MRSRELKKVLNESHINPNRPGPLKILVEIDNPAYWETRAIELIKEAQTHAVTLKDYHQNIRDAITLLALARTHHVEAVQSGSQPVRTGGKNTRGTG